jgi:hypothetical protein
MEKSKYNSLRWCKKLVLLMELMPQITIVVGVGVVTVAAGVVAGVTGVVGVVADAVDAADIGVQSNLRQELPLLKLSLHLK